MMDLIKEFAKQNKIGLKTLDVHDIKAYEVDKKDIIKLLEFIKNSKELRFTILTDLFAADFPSREKRFEIVFSLLSLKLNERVIFKSFIAESEEFPSTSKVFNASAWYEREIFDMFGVKFKDLEDHRRILTDYGFKGHPLRKDFPVTGYVEVVYDEKLEEVIYVPVELEQEFRNFDFSSPWKGPKKYLLPGDEKAIKDN